MAKHIFVTGGVVSSLGKGLTSASLALVLERRGLRIAIQKCDPYINVDPGTMSPYQHGEVYVTTDGAETDLDLGHYERFTSARLTQDCNITTGSIYNKIIQKERRGDYLGKTVQVIPHVTNEIKNAIHKLATDDVDIVITEIGGTVGDIESLPFLEAIRQFRLDVGKQNAIYVHLTLVPYLKAAKELKTKPTQHSVGLLRQIGIQPDILVCRTECSMSPEHMAKIALFCNMEEEAVIEEKDLEHGHLIYELPLVLAEHGLDELVVKKLGIECEPADLSDWTAVVERMRNPAHQTEIAVVGKYITLRDAYKSIYEALTHGGIANDCRVNIRMVESQDVETQGAEACLAGVHGVLVPGGFGYRGIEGKVQAVRYARENRIPYFGICLGMQCAVIEFARNVCGFRGANSAEFDEQTPHPVIDLMETQKNIDGLGGTMRLGCYGCELTPGTHARAAYGVSRIEERHRHRYEYNNAYREKMRAKGMVFAGVSPDGHLVEIAEITDHPWFVAVQFHPEFQSKPDKPHPLFRDFVAQALEHGAAEPVPTTDTATA
jgi:CTP synthase